MNDSKENKIKKFLEFNKPEDYTNDADTTSQNYRQFNNTKYVKLYNPYLDSWNNSTTITNNSTTYKIGDTVLVSENSPKKSDMKGKIVFGSSKEDSDKKLRIEFKDGSKEFIDIGYVSKIAEQDYRED